MPGDRYGGAGHRKVKKMLIDNKIPVSARSALPMVACGDKVIWVPGFRPAGEFEVKPDSTRCICMQIKRLG
jgi:tRNA(Ile)-lysidine synthase